MEKKIYNLYLLVKLIFKKKNNVGRERDWI